MSYYNRRDQLDYTFQTMTESFYKDFEVIVVDDFSNEPIDDLIEKYSQLNIKNIHMSMYGNKWYSNPCIPYNVGFEYVEGDKVILQNPECCHIGDVISYVENNLTDDNYLSFHCYASSQADLPKIKNNEPIEFVNGKQSRGACWYNHQEFRPRSYHFTTALTTSNLVKLRGFDDRFAEGRAYDDDEFVFRVRNLGLNIEYVSDPYVIHQWHPKSYSKEIPTNSRLFAHIRKTEPTNYRAHRDYIYEKSKS